MHKVCSVDYFVSPIALEQFAERQDAGRAAFRSTGLDSSMSAIIGGTGLAIQDFDTYTGMGTPFDADVMASDDAFEHMAPHWTAQNPDYELHEDAISFPGGEHGLPLTILKKIPPNLAQTTGARTFKELGGDIIQVDGLPTLPVAVLAEAKLLRKDPKDIAGIIKGYFVAWANNSDSRRNKDLLKVVQSAMYFAFLLESSSRRSDRKSIPTWLGKLAASGYDHPAFRIEVAA